MYWKLLKNDISNNRLQSFNIAFFIVLSDAFLAVAAQLAIRLNTSVSTLFKKAKTPHLLQIHTKEIDRERMEVFVESHPEIEIYTGKLVDYREIFWFGAWVTELHRELCL